MKTATSILLLAAALFFSRHLSAQTNELQGFTVNDIRFDESLDTNKPLPKIPASWRFVGVSSCKVNGSNLWFQDKAGNIFLVSGFNDDGGVFVANETIQKFNAAVDPVFTTNSPVK